MYIPGFGGLAAEYPVEVFGESSGFAVAPGVGTAERSDDDDVRPAHRFLHLLDGDDLPVLADTVVCLRVEIELGLERSEEEALQNVALQDEIEHLAAVRCTLLLVVLSLLGAMRIVFLTHRVADVNESEEERPKVFRYRAHDLVFAHGRQLRRIAPGNRGDCFVDPWKFHDPPPFRKMKEKKMDWFEPITFLYFCQ